MSADSGLAQQFAAYSGYHSTPEAGHELFRLAHDAGCPVAHSDQLGGFHILMDYAEVRRAHQDWTIYSHEPSVMRPLVDRPGFPPLEYDPPAHTPWRELVKTLFNRAAADRVEPLIRADISQMIDQIGPAGQCDLVTVFAEEVPMLVLCHLLGLAGAKRAEVRERTLAVMAAAEDPERGALAFMDFAAFGIAEVHARRNEFRDDGLSQLASWQMGGERPMTDLEIGQAMNSILIAGHGTSISAIGSLFHDVVSRPTVHDALIADPSLVRAAVEESLRLHHPFFGLYRTLTESVTVAGSELAAGESVQLCWAAANRDPRVFDEPDEFRLDRPITHNRHLGFGFGIHTCPGQLVVRMELHVLLTEVLRRLPDIRLGEPEAVCYAFGGGEMAGISSLPVFFTPPKH